jgi:hypothetical protein
MVAWWAEGAWASALALLLLNDHVLKGSGWLPGVVTGKLSDFAGLIVAPVLAAVLVALAGLRGRRARFVCFAAVSAVFAAIKLSSEAARAFESALASVGLPSRVWSDPTDLVALGVLPLAWRVSASLEESVSEKAPRLAHVFGTMLGGAACLATSAPSPWEYRTSAYLVSMARTPVTVKLSRVTAALDCGALEANIDALGAVDFEPTFCLKLDPGDILPLDRDFSGSDTKELKGPGEEEPPCDAVLLGAEGLAPTIVFWQKGKERAPANGQDREELDPSAVYLEPAGQALYLAGSNAMHVRTLDGPVPDVDCASLERPKGLP